MSFPNEQRPPKDEVILSRLREVERKRISCQGRINHLGALVSIREESAGRTNKVLIPAAGLPGLIADLTEIQLAIVKRGIA